MWSVQRCSKNDAAGNLTLPAPIFLKQGRSQKFRAKEGRCLESGLSTGSRVKFPRNSFGSQSLRQDASGIDRAGLGGIRLDV